MFWKLAFWEKTQKTPKWVKRNVVKIFHNIAQLVKSSISNITQFLIYHMERLVTDLKLRELAPHNYRYSTLLGTKLGEN